MSLQKYKDDAIVKVDEIASKVGMNFISAESNYIIHEYTVAADAANKWLEDTSKPCPQLITAWSLAGDMDNKQAAEYIIQKQNEFNGLVAAIRQLRLITKVKIRESSSTQEVDVQIETLQLRLVELYQYQPL